MFQPVSDLGWRPQVENMLAKQEKPVPAIYTLPLVSSGAIQHLAGVSSSK